jgi:phage terminase small subunit
MPRGGYRPGAGRPPGSKEVPRPARAPVQCECKGGAETALQYLARVMNDRSADIARRDRCALALAAIEARTGDLALGKRARALRDAETAGLNSEWTTEFGNDLLHSCERPERDAADWGSDLDFDSTAAQPAPRQR